MARVIIPFGKHKGCSIEQIPTSYLRWLANQINKAYLHLLLSNSDIADKYPNTPPNQRIVKPLGQYQKYFTQNFAIIGKKVVQQNIEPWIVKNLVPTIEQLWYPGLDQNQIIKILQTGGVYYTLKKLSNPI